MKNIRDEALKFDPAKADWALVDFLRTPPNKFAIMLPYVLLGLIGVTFSYAALTKVPIAIKAAGQLIPEKPTIPVVNLTSGKVTQVHVKEGDLVKRGQLLLENDALIREEILKKLGEIHQLLGVLVRSPKTSACNDSCVVSLRDNGQRAALLLRGINDLEKSWMERLLNPYNEHVDALERRQKISGTVAEERRRLKLTEEKIRAIKAAKGEKYLAQQLEQLEREKASTNLSLKDRMVDAQTSVEQTFRHFVVIHKRFTSDLDRYQIDNKIFAPISGYVWKLGVTAAGQPVPLGAELLQIIPDDSQLIAELKVKSSDISGVKEGLEVIVELDALPKDEYDVIRGRVIKFALKTEEQSGGAAKMPEPYYKVLVSLPVQSLKKDGKVYPFRYGMTTQGQIVTKRESMLKIGLKKIFKVADSLS